MDSRKILSSFVWRLLERSGAQGVSLVVSIVLARLILPEDYGTIAIVQIVITLLDAFVDGGFASALIQKKEVDDLDFSTVFYANLAFCTGLYTLTYAFAPAFAQFYHDSRLVLLLRVMALQLFISSLKNVQQAYVAKHMLFKKFFFSTLGGTIGAAFVGITMAYWGFGVWALVAQQIFNQLVDTLIIWYTVRWRPIKHFSFQRLKALLPYSTRILAALVTDKLYANLNSFVIGKKYTSADLAFYNRGNQFPSIIVSNASTALDSVLFPVLSKAQNDKQEVYTIVRKTIRISIYIIAPMMMGLATVAPTVVNLILTETWEPSVFYMRIFCYVMMLYPLNTVHQSTIKALGYSSVFLKLEVYKKIVGLLILLFTFSISVKTMAVGTLVTAVVSMLINAFPNRHIIGYTYCEFLQDIFPAILISAVMCLFVNIFDFFHWNAIITLSVQIVAGTIFYVGTSALIKMRAYEDVVEGLFQFLKKR